MRRLGGLPGGGPWRILDECGAVYHNSAHAAKKGAGPKDASVQRRALKCVCPRALERLAESNALTRGRRAELGVGRTGRASGRPKDSGGVPRYFRNIRKNVPVPDLGSMECHTPHGLKVMDLAQEKHWKGEALKAAKGMCERCPMRVECLAWPTAAEVPAGDWPGIYGGMTHMERKQAGAKAA